MIELSATEANWHGDKFGNSVTKVSAALEPIQARIQNLLSVYSSFCQTCWVLSLIGREKRG